MIEYSELVKMYSVKSIISAGQTGADYGALLAAKELNLDIQGYANSGYRTENGPNYELRDLFKLNENSKTSYADTDRKNVNLADAVLAFRYRIPNTGRGTECTVNYAITKKYKHEILDNKNDYEVYQGKKPVIVFWDLNGSNLEKFSQFLKEFILQYQPGSLMITGPCQSTVDCSAWVKLLLIKTLT